MAAAGIYVIHSVYPWGGAAADVVVERVRAVRRHPAISMWAVGNEWNYNGLYVGLSHDDAVARLNEAVALIKAEDDAHPVATIYGELPDVATLAALPGLDVWWEAARFRCAAGGLRAGCGPVIGPKWRVPLENCRAPLQRFSKAPRSVENRSPAPHFAPPELPLTGLGPLGA
jgi:hypothetical protein